MERIVLGYTGGLTTTVAIAWMREHYRAEIIAVVIDIGQGSQLTEVRARALASGAIRAHVLDVREEFARRFVVPSLRAEAVGQDGFPMAEALGGPLIAERLVQMASLEGATAIAHGCNGPRKRLRCLEIALADLDSGIEIRPIARRFDMSESEQLAFAAARRLPLPIAADRPFVVRSNLWGRSVEWIETSDHGITAPLEAYTLTRSPVDCPDEPASIDISFERGIPSAINGVAMPLVELTSSLTMLAGSHGVGRTSAVMPAASRRSRLCRIAEAPAAVLLHRAHSELQKRVSPAPVERVGRAVSREYARVISSGRWFSPLREALDAYVDQVQQRVTGVVRLTLLKGEFGVAASDAFDDRAAARGSAHGELPAGQ
jgi:argininosuccinate synthase